MLKGSLTYPLKTSKGKGNPEKELSITFTKDFSDFVLGNLGVQSLKIEELRMLARV